VTDHDKIYAFFCWELKLHEAVSFQGEGRARIARRRDIGKGGEIIAIGSSRRDEEQKGKEYHRIINEKHSGEVMVVVVVMRVGLGVEW
jgi:hypothetical protein